MFLFLSFYGFQKHVDAVHTMNDGVEKEGKPIFRADDYVHESARAACSSLFTPSVFKYVF